ncbi:hypothetical protein [Marinobacter salsuginis]|uniref:Uncharacterized protein n=1 Tax=Marinobacter salsuginis TaxID=418719 RepID=A0A5M3PTC3_9GAMM|nr:hypothetical protein [Marinobacter salsuginis]GBO86192.1 hypothetical protein MS5N3_36430 [Marinobacter salsuginis]|tara:strand:+ start:35 stop:400 length:366 start_codon:yes stop_codon:yes gene_type:complete
MIRETLALSAKLVGFLMVGFFIPATALANEDLDVTMRMVTDDAELTDSVVREIELPRAIERPENPGKSGSRGLDAASEARERGREFGESMSEKARQSRELIKGKPERPERPELPDAPGLDR